MNYLDIVDFGLVHCLELRDPGRDAGEIILHGVLGVPSDVLSPRVRDRCQQQTRHTTHIRRTNLHSADILLNYPLIVTLGFDKQGLYTLISHAPS
jgi:hypothetical protein